MNSAVPVRPTGRRPAALDDPRATIDLSTVREPDLGTLEVLCRATLEARRRGEALRCTAASAELRALIVLCGLERYLRMEAVLAEDEAEGTSLGRPG